MKPVQFRDRFRQVDSEFSDILDKIRVGDPLSQLEENLLFKSSKHDLLADTRVCIYPLRDDVCNENMRNFHRLPGQPFEFRCVDEYYWFVFQIDIICGLCRTS